MSIATWNITDGRCAGLESAGKALEEAGVDIAFVQESKFMDDAYATKYVGPYTILTSATDRFNCGGVSLFYKAGSKYNLENGRAVGPNCITFELETGETRYYVIGAYLPPSDLTGSFRAVEHALGQIPKGCILMLLGDLNVDLDVPRNEREAEIAAKLDSFGLACATKHFRVRTTRRGRRRKLRGKWSYRRRRTDRGESVRGWY